MLRCTSHRPAGSSTYEVSMSESPPNVPTVGEIARRYGVQVHQVEYVIRTRRLQPVGKGGNAHIYSDADMEFIGAELKRIAQDKEGLRGRGNGAGHGQ